jgi:hypothetical protein
MANKLIPIKEKLKKYVVDSKNCWNWLGSKDKDGYGVFGHHRNKQLRAHRASYDFYIGEIPTGMLVCHYCDNPSCINPKHLFLGTSKDNTQDMIKKQRKLILFGENHPNAKLTEQQANEIKQLRKQNKPLTEIANQFGISFQTVSSIAKGKTWKRI